MGSLSSSGTSRPGQRFHTGAADDDPCTVIDGRASWLLVHETSLPPVAAVISFIDAINRGDVDRLGELMTVHHPLDVFDEPPLHGRDANLDAWRGYATAFPEYVIYPERIVEHDGQVAVLGHTTGSHLGLPDVDEMDM